MTKIKLLAALDERQIILFTLIASSPPFPNGFIGLWYYRHPANWRQHKYLILGQCFFHISVLLWPSVLPCSHLPWVKGKETNLRNTTWVERMDLQIIQVRESPGELKRQQTATPKLFPGCDVGSIFFCLSGDNHPYPVGIPLDHVALRSWQPALRTTWV